MNEAFAGWVYPTVRYVLDAGGVGQERSRAKLSEREYQRLKHRLGELEFAGQDPRATAAAKRALIHWLDDQYRQRTAGREADRQQGGRDAAAEPGDDGSSFFAASIPARAFESPDAAEIFYLCAALGYRGKYPANLEHLPTFDDWARSFLSRIDPKLPARFDPIAMGVSYDPETDALPLLGHLVSKRSTIFLVVAAILAVASLGLWVWLKFWGG